MGVGWRRGVRRRDLLGVGVDGAVLRPFRSCSCEGWEHVLAWTISFVRSFGPLKRTYGSLVSERCQCCR